LGIKLISISWVLLPELSWSRRFSSFSLSGSICECIIAAESATIFSFQERPFFFKKVTNYFGRKKNEGTWYIMGDKVDFLRLPPGFIFIKALGALKQDG
jgi:hypothetical protein